MTGGSVGERENKEERRARVRISKRDRTMRERRNEEKNRKENLKGR